MVPVLVRVQDPQRHFRAVLRADDLQERASFLARFLAEHEPELIRRVIVVCDWESRTVTVSKFWLGPCRC